MKFLSFDSEVKCSNYRQRQRSTALPITSNVFVMMYVGVYVLYVLYVCVCVCGFICWHNKTKTPDQNDLKLGSNPWYVSKPIDFGFKRSGLGSGLRHGRESVPVCISGECIFLLLDSLMSANVTSAYLWMFTDDWEPYHVLLWTFDVRNVVRQAAWNTALRQHLIHLSRWPKYGSPAILIFVYSV